MTSAEIKKVEQLKEYYGERKTDKFDKLMALHRKVERPANIFAYTFGILSALILGVGMCLAMRVIGDTVAFFMPLGIVIGLLGIAGVSVNYFLYKRILMARKEKYSKEILEISDEILNN